MTATATKPDRLSQNPEFMSLKELSERTGISLTRTYQLAREDRLPVPTIRFGRQFRFSRKAYEALVNPPSEA